MTKIKMDIIVITRDEFKERTPYHYQAVGKMKCGEDGRCLKCVISVPLPGVGCLSSRKRITPEVHKKLEGRFNISNQLLCKFALTEEEYAQLEFPYEDM